MRITQFFNITLSVFLSGGIASAGIFSKAKPQELAVRTTAYTHTEADHIEYGRKTAAGGILKYGKKYSSAAADWSKFPLGTKFKIDGMDTTFVVDDYGSALVGTETIDIYKPSRSAMNKWGVKHVDIKILEYGDFEKSREILEQRTKYSHVRKMLAGIKKSPGPKPQKKSKTAPESEPFIPAPPKADLAPVMQLASAPPSPKPAPIPAPKPAPTPAPAKPKLPTPPVVAPPPIPEAYSSPTLAAATTPTPPIPEVKPATSPPAPAVAPAPAPRPSIPAPALRKVQPLQLATVTRQAATPPSEPVASEAPAQAKPAEPPSNQLRKRAFRPLMASVNG